MDFAELDPVAILASTVAGFIFGAVWYGALSKPWMQAVGLSEPPKPDPKLYAMTFVCQLVLAAVIHVILTGQGDLSVGRQILSVALLWAGFVVAPMVVNHRFQSQPWLLTFIDLGHWLGVFVVIVIAQSFF